MARCTCSSKFNSSQGLGSQPKAPSLTACTACGMVPWPDKNNIKSVHAMARRMLNNAMPPMPGSMRRSRITTPSDADEIAVRKSSPDLKARTG